MLAMKHSGFLAIVLALALGAAASFSGDVQAQEGEKPAKAGEERVAEILKQIEESSKKSTPIPAFRDKRDEFKEDELAKAIKARFPDLDLDGKHNIKNVDNPAKGQERETYTRAMLRVIDFWLQLDMGAMLNKILVLQNDGNVTNPTLLVLTAYFEMKYGLSFESADRSLSKALELDSEFVSALWVSASFMARRNKGAEAITLLNLVLKHDPNHADALFKKAVLHSSSGQPDKAIEPLKKLINLKPADRYVLRNAIHIFQAIDLEAATELLSKVLPDYGSSPLANEVRYGIARSAKVEERFEDSISQANDLLATPEAKTDPEFAFEVRRDLQFWPLFELYLAARVKIAVSSGEEKSKAEKEAASLLQRIEASAKENIDLDIAKFPFHHRRKGFAAQDLYSVLVEAKRNKDALEILVDYDKRAKRLMLGTREGLRTQISNLKIVVEGRVDVTVLGQYFEAQKYAECTSDITKYLLSHQNDPEKFDFTDKALIEILTKASKASDRLLAGKAMHLLGVAASQLEETEGKLAIQKTIEARLKTASEAKEKTAGLYRLMRNGIYGLAAIGEKSSANALLDYIEARFKDSPSESDRDQRSLFADTFWKKAIGSVSKSHSSLSDLEISRSLLRFGGSRLSRDVSKWLESARTALAKE